jgi:hypothetical protein
MLFSMLDPRFKNCWLVSSFISRKQDVCIVEYYDRQSLFSMLLKCHHMTKYEYMANQLNDEDSNLDILKMIARTSGPTKELQMFKRYQVDACFLEWWGKHESLFLIDVFLACKILNIMRSQIETEKL